MKITAENAEAHSEKIVQKLYERPTIKDVDGFYDFESDKLQMIKIIRDYFCQEVDKVDLSHTNHNTNIIRYAWVNLKLKTWFFTKTKKQILPKGSKLVFVVNGKETDKPIDTSDTFPYQNSVVLDIDGLRMEVKDTNWV